MQELNTIAQTLVNNKDLQVYFNTFEFSKETLQVSNKELTDKQKNFFKAPKDLLEVRENLNLNISNESNNETLKELETRLGECESDIENYIKSLVLSDDITLYIQSSENKSRNIISQSKNYDLNTYTFNSLAWINYKGLKIPFGFGQGFSSLLFLGTRPKDLDSLNYGLLNELVTYVNNELKPTSKSNAPKISELKNEILLAKLESEYIMYLVSKQDFETLTKFNLLDKEDKAEILLAYNESK